MRFILQTAFAALIVLTTFSTGGCETTNSNTQASQKRRESSIPWNRPAKWEGAGALGGSMPQNY